MAAIHLTLERLVEILGLADALRLVEKRGGVAAYVPQPDRVKAHCELAQAMSLEGARKLAALYPMERLMVPRGAAHLRRERDIAVLKAVRNDSVSQVALEFQLTERHVYRIMERGLEGLPPASAAPNDAQGDLFGENA